MKKTLAFAVTLFAACISGPAMAGRAPAPSDELDKFYINFWSSTRAMSSFARCLISRDMDHSRSILLAAYGSPEQNMFLRAFAEGDNNCLYNLDSMQANGLFFMGAMAEGLMRQEGLGKMMASPISVPTAPGGSYVWKNKRLQGQDMVDLARVGQCVVLKDQPAVMALLARQSATEGERKQINAMKPLIASCVPAGRTVVLEPLAFRAAVAYVQYVYSHSPHGEQIVRLEAIQQ